MEGIQTQITATEQRIAASTGNIEQWTAEVQELIKQNAPKSQKMLLVKKVSATRKARSILQGQLAQLEDALLSAQSGEVAVEGRATQQLVDACAQLARNASKDPAVNPYFYSRNEAKPEHAAVAHKRASMRARGKNPGPWTSSLDAHNMRSAEQEEGADSILIGVEAERVAAARGQKKKRRGKKGNRSKMKKSKKSKSKSKSRRRR
jgi:hypothetical protein